MRRLALIAMVLPFYYGNSQTVINTDSIFSNKDESVFVKSLFADSLVSSYCILIPNEVKQHKHASHSEHVFVLAGEGRMTLGKKHFTIKKGDLLFIPKNTLHAVKSTSKIPLKVLSIQAPFFDGSDRIFEDADDRK